MLPSIAQHARIHGISPLKKYGQNFIFDQSLCDKIVTTSGLKPGDNVLEIGPGVAGLTRAILAKNPKLLTVIEMDKRCLALLQDIGQHYPNLEIIAGDALLLSLSGLSGEGIHIIGNLPYNIGTKLLVNWLKQIEFVSKMTLMLQKEVAHRICSSPGSKSYGRLSVICQLTCAVEKSFDLKPQAFYPPPKVHSSIVQLTPKQEQPDSKLLDKVELITAMAFSERRKMIKSSLKKLGPDIESILSKLGLNSHMRAENLSPQNYLSLATMCQEAGDL